MTCDDIRGLFSEFYDDGEADEYLIQHLQECSGCAAEYRAFKRLMIDVQNLPAPELPHNFHESLMARVRKHARKNGQISPKQRPAWVKFVLAAAVVLWAVAWVSSGIIFDNMNQPTVYDGWIMPIIHVDEVDDGFEPFVSIESIGEDLFPAPRGLLEPMPLTDIEPIQAVEPDILISYTPRLWLFVTIGAIPFIAWIVIVLLRKKL
ncbi:MAG: hypothetical protein FWE05_09235 [Defluviitaleaceae bacterium]|nr:hypothetical protein [Defluviitaleaceae bacterium]